MNSKTNIDKDIYKRSEKVQNLLGQVPPSIIRMSMITMIVIMLTLILVMCLISYPYSDGESIMRHLIKNI